jgi:hypothetical protein
VIAAVQDREREQERVEISHFERAQVADTENLNVTAANQLI